MPNLAHDPTWSPRLGFTGKIIDENGARSLKESVLSEDWEFWARREDAPFKAIPPVKPEKWPAAPLHVLKSQLRQLIPFSMDWLEQYVEDYNQRVYQGLMSPNAKRLLREMKKEYEEYLLGESRIDNNTGHDDQ